MADTAPRKKRCVNIPLGSLQQQKMSRGTAQDAADGHEISSRAMVPIVTVQRVIEIPQEIITVYLITYRKWSGRACVRAAGVAVLCRLALDLTTTTTTTTVPSSSL
jgi:hypothetical protein